MEAQLMSDKLLIDISGVISAQKEYHGTCAQRNGTKSYSQFEGTMFDAITEYLMSFPVIDAVEVTRCDDCWKRGRPGVCPMCQLGVYGAVPPYDKNVDLTEDSGFCHRGERRGECA